MPSSIRDYDFGMTYLVCIKQVIKVKKYSNCRSLEDVNSKHGNSTKFGRILSLDIKNDHANV